MRRTLYLDTMLWNRLYEQAVEPRTLTTALKERGWELAISPHVMYELAKAFRGKRAESQAKAAPLFAYVEGFLEFPISYAKQVPDLLRHEVRVALGQFAKIDPFYRDAERDRMTEEIRQLAAGRVDPRFDVLLWQRRHQIKTFRANGPERAMKWDSWRRENGDLTFDSFTQMCWREFYPRGLELHIQDVMTLPPKSAKHAARKMLSAKKFRFCRALVRANIYLDWLSFQGRSIQRDVQDDCYHIENAAHCDAYATDEPGQEMPTQAILQSTEVRIHDKKGPLWEWLTTAAIQ